MEIQKMRTIGNLVKIMEFCKDKLQKKNYSSLFKVITVVIEKYCRKYECGIELIYLLHHLEYLADFLQALWKILTFSEDTAELKRRLLLVQQGRQYGDPVFVEPHIANGLWVQNFIRSAQLVCELENRRNHQHSLSQKEHCLTLISKIKLELCTIFPNRTIIEPTPSDSKQRKVAKIIEQICQFIRDILVEQETTGIQSLPEKYLKCSQKLNQLKPRNTIQEFMIIHLRTLIYSQTSEQQKFLDGTQLFINGDTIKSFEGFFNWDGLKNFWEPEDSLQIQQFLESIQQQIRDGSKFGEIYCGLKEVKRSCHLRVDGIPLSDKDRLCFVQKVCKRLERAYSLTENDIKNILSYKTDDIEIRFFKVYKQIETQNGKRILLNHTKFRKNRPEDQHCSYVIRIKKINFDKNQGRIQEEREEFSSYQLQETVKDTSADS